GRAGPGGGGDRGRGEAPAQAFRARTLRRPAAAALHRARDRGRARRRAPRRARLGTRPDLDPGDRGPDARAQANLHARDRDPQHAAGCARRRDDGVLQPPGRGRREPPRHPRRVRLDREDLHLARRRAHGGVRHRSVRMRVLFHEELDKLEAALQEEGDFVLRALRSALNALARGDDELADEVIGFDDEIDSRYLAIETGVQSLLARQTPVATDLRLVLAILRVNLHLERMADYCVTVAQLTKL